MRADHLERTRTDLLEALETEASQLSAQDLQLVQRMQPWLATAALAYEGDLVSNAIRSEAGLASLLERPAVYVRGPQKGFSDSERVVETAAESGKDSFVLCLLDPPEERSEDAMLEKAHAAQRAVGVAEERTANVRRLYDAIVGLRLLAPEWVKKVRETDDIVHLFGLRDLFEKSPIARATQAAKAELLLYVVDEPRESGITEMDGANIHHVRVVIVDLSKSEVVLRTRRRVDPTWVSLKRRSRYAREFNSCALALDVRTTTRFGSPPACPTAAATWKSRNRRCWRAASTSCTASTGTRAATWARS
jgi:hypothetical protein